MFFSFKGPSFHCQHKAQSVERRVTVRTSCYCTRMRRRLSLAEKVQIGLQTDEQIIKTSFPTGVRLRWFSHGRDVAHRGRDACDSCKHMVAIRQQVRRT